MSGKISVSAGSAQLPSSPPTGNVTIFRGTQNRTFSLQQIYDYTVNSTKLLVQNYTYTLGGSTIEARGIDPLWLFYFAGWYDCRTFQVKGKDGNSSVIDVSKFILNDKNMTKSPKGHAVMLLMSAGNTWLQNWVSALGTIYGNFVVAGDTGTNYWQLSSQDKIANVTKIYCTTNWTVKVTFNRVPSISVGYNNVTNIGNYTTYTWGYTGLSPATSYATANYTGITVPSLLHLTGMPPNQTYKVNFIAVDGYLTATYFNRTQIEQGYKPGDDVGNSTNHVILNCHNMQPILAIKRNGTNLGYDSGAFWLIIPGASKSKYIKQVEEIRLFTIFPPSMLSATAGNSLVNLTWQRPTTYGNYTYKIYRGTVSSSETYLATTAINATSFTDTGLTNGQTYYYQVSSVNASGESGYSNEASARPKTVPGAPQGLVATADTMQVVLSWSAPSSNGGAAITMYKILRGTSSGSEAYLANVTDALNYTDNDVAIGTKYYYKVVAVNVVGDGAASNEASAVPTSSALTPGYPVEVLFGLILATTFVVVIIKKKARVKA